MGASPGARRKFIEWLVKSSKTLPFSEGHRGSIAGLCQFGTRAVFRKH